MHLHRGFLYVCPGRLRAQQPLHLKTALQPPYRLHLHSAFVQDASDLYQISEKKSKWLLKLMFSRPR